MNIPLRYHGAEKGELRSLKTKIEIYQRAIREWVGHLSSYEFAVVMQILDRTIGWGTREATFDVEKLHTGDTMYRGLKTTMSRRKMFDCLNALEEKGLLCRSKGARQRVRFSISQDWKCARPNEQQDCRPVIPAHSGVPDTHLGVHDTHSIDRYSSTGNHSTDNQQRPPVTPIVRQNEIGIRTSGGILAPDFGPIETAWHAAFAEAFPAISSKAWGKREQFLATQAIKGWVTRDGPIEDFVSWAVRGWTAIISAQFGWMKDPRPPSLPTERFFFGQIGQFQDCLAEEKLEKWCSSSERTEIEKLMQRGQTRAEALTTIGKRRAVSTLRREMATERAKAADRNKAADFKVAEARRLLELAEQPVHPRSRLALQARAAVRSRSPLWASLGNDVEPLSAKVLEAPKVSFEG